MITLPPVKQVGGGSLNQTVLRWHGPAFGGGLASRSVVLGLPCTTGLGVYH